MSIKPSLRKRFAGAITVLTYAFVVVVLVTFFGGLAWCGSVGCEGDRESAKHVVEGAGFTKVEVGGAHAWACGRDDSQSNTFTAISSTGRYVEGTVCCSYNGCGKGCTLRFSK